jgi:hypothetical protein
MSNQITKQAIVVSQTTPKLNQQSEMVAFFNSSGDPLTVSEVVAHQADTTAADLAAMKVDFNLLLAKLQAAGVMASS